jgi:poly(3-hydroxybutyrate) depolymerase
MSDGGPDPDKQGDLAYQRQGPAHRVLPAIVFQGSADDTVDPRNADQVIQQIAQMNDHADDGNGANDSIDAQAGPPETTPAGPDRHAFTIHSYRDGAGGLVMQKVLVQDLGHAWSGGSPDGSFTDTQGPEASRMMWAFFKGRTLGDD